MEYTGRNYEFFERCSVDYTLDKFYRMIADGLFFFAQAVTNKMDWTFCSFICGHVRKVSLLLSYGNQPFLAHIS